MVIPKIIPAAASTTKLRFEIVSQTSPSTWRSDALRFSGTRSPAIWPCVPRLETMIEANMMMPTVRASGP